MEIRVPAGTASGNVPCGGPKRRPKTAALWGTPSWAGFEAGTGQQGRPEAAPETRFQRPRIAARSTIRWEGVAVVETVVASDKPHGKNRQAQQGIGRSPPELE